MRLFIHSWRQVIGNFAQATRIGLVLLLINLVGPLLPVLGFGTAGLALLTLANLLVSVTTAIAWHRYVLLGDASKADPFNPPPGAFMAYFMYALRVAVLLFIGVVLVSGVASVLASMVLGAGFMVELPDGTVAPGPAYWPILGIVAVLMNTLFNRFALGFAAIAVGKRVSLQQSWQQTAPMNGQILITSVLMVLGIGLLQSIAMGLHSPSAGAALLGFVTAVPMWILTMIGISVLTTLYGHLVEGRPLNA